MKILGAIGTKQLQILIDSGSIDNFVNEKLIEKLHCTVQEVGSMPVTIADGTKLPCMKVCKGFQWSMQGSWFKADMMVIPLSNYDIVLGVQWLQTLNHIMWNFKKLIMQFTINGQPYELKGTMSKGVSLCSMEKLNSWLTHLDQIMECQLFSLFAPDNSNFQHHTHTNKVQPFEPLEALLEKYQDVFEIPTGLPPFRDCDHKIKLNDENINLNLKPYRYPSIQKTIIEQMTQELLDTGVIWNN
ncbi:uncharacterized protein LOC143575510 [Bidens hawaiensis]|uniref:uncharacterized protein LOC143575510 n=1 Tax=Bidens hawaiensis TaxID=980011 RepID=UPI00404A959E